MPEVTRNTGRGRGISDLASDGPANGSRNIPDADPTHKLRQVLPGKRIRNPSDSGSDQTAQKVKIEQNSTAHVLVVTCDVCAIIESERQET